MKLKYEFEIMELGNDTIAVPVGEGAQEYHGVIKMNESASAIFEILKTDTTEEKIVSLLEKDYDTPRAELAKLVHETIQQLQDRNMLIL